MESVIQAVDTRQYYGTAGMSLEALAREAATGGPLDVIHMQATMR